MLVKKMYRELGSDGLLHPVIQEEQETITEEVLKKNTAYGDIVLRTYADGTIMDLGYRAPVGGMHGR